MDNDGTINYQYLTQGYTCTLCNQFVPSGVTHVCTSTFNPQPDYKYFQLIQIGQILERIAQTLEAIEKRLPAD